MANTTFVPQTTRISSTWLNDINNFKYVLFNGAESSTEAREAINAVNKAGDTLDGFLTLHADPSSDMHAATKQYVDDSLSGVGVTNPLILEENASLPSIFLVDSVGDGVCLSYNPSLNIFYISTAVANEADQDIFTFNMTTGVATARNVITSDWAVDPALE